MSDETPAQPGAADTAPGGTPTTESGAESTPPKSRASFEVPRWAALVVAALLLLGVGFAIGWVAAPGGGDHHGRELPAGRVFPGPGRGRLPQTPGAAPGATSGVFLGVATTDATGNAGAQIATVAPGSPADQSGLKAGDVVTAVDGQSVTSAAQLAQQVRAHQPGDQVTVTYTRNGASAQATVKLGSRGQPQGPSA
jgi:putative serine protease PepD